MNRSIAIVGAPTSIGIRTYDSGEPRQLDRAPGVLRDLGLVQRLGASDLVMSSRPRIETTYVQRAGRGTKLKSSPIAGRSASGWRRQPETAVLQSCWAAIAASCWEPFWVRGSLRKDRWVLSTSTLTLTSGHPKSLTLVRWPVCASPLQSVAERHLWLGSRGTRLSYTVRMSF